MGPGYCTFEGLSVIAGPTGLVSAKAGKLIHDVKTVFEGIHHCRLGASGLTHSMRNEGPEKSEFTINRNCFEGCSKQLASHLKTARNMC